MKQLLIDLDQYTKVKGEISIRDFLLLNIKHIGKLNYIPIVYHNVTEYHDSLKELERKQFIKITDDCVSYDENIATPNLECFELRGKATDLFDTKTVDLESLANKLREIFPAKVRGGAGKPVRSSSREVIDKLKKFFKYYPLTKEEEVLNATTKYIENRRRVNWAYITQLDYFIFKDNSSMLAAEIDNLKEEEEINPFDTEA